MSKHKHHDAIVAWARGAEVEFQSGETWVTAGQPLWDPNTAYRVKPPKPAAPNGCPLDCSPSTLCKSPHCMRQKLTDSAGPAPSAPPLYLVGQRVLVNDTEIGTVTIPLPGRTAIAGCVWVRPASKDYSLCYRPSAIKPLPGGQL